MDSRTYDRLGAHLTVEGGVRGVRFSVWAPNARDVSVICERNRWQHGATQLQSSDTGVWTGFLPEMVCGEAYKYSLRTPSGEVIDKADPYAFRTELRPDTASIVCDLSGFDWRDGDWLTGRRDGNWLQQPISIYEVHLGSWRRPGDGRTWFSYQELADQLIEYCSALGYTHIQLLPITEHPFDGSWGYQVTAYFAPTSRFGSPHDFMEFVNRCHQAGLGVLIDWVPAHFPNDPHGLAWFDGTACYEHDDPRRGIHPDWDTHIFNYNRNEVRDFLLSSARFWCETYHVDGIRVDAVASMLYLDYSRDSGQWIPNEHGGRENLDAISLLRELNTLLHGEFPGVVTIAEESTAWPGVSRPIYDGGLGFSMKWDMGWMHDTLKYLRRDPIHRCHHQNELSFRAMYAASENFVLPLSHDEVVHGKRSLLSQMPGDEWQQFANLRLLYSYQFACPGKKMLFMGGELGQWLEWNHDSQVDWALQEYPQHSGIQQLITDLNQLYRDSPALHERDFDADGFQWISCDDWEKSTLAFVRWNATRDDWIVIALNFTPVTRENYRIGVPRRGFYRDVFNSDASAYGGSNTINTEGTYSAPVPMHGFTDSLTLTLPPLAMLALQPVRA
ncbi:MAG: 1,4-alpha-glucan branching protein GlgB [Planctomycetota bacterium]